MKIGDRVLYVPAHAQGNRDHPDVEKGVITGVQEEIVHVRFGNQTLAKGCYPRDLVPDPTPEVFIRPDCAREIYGGDPYGPEPPCAEGRLTEVARNLYQGGAILRVGVMLCPACLARRAACQSDANMVPGPRVELETLDHADGDVVVSETPPDDIATLCAQTRELRQKLDWAEGLISRLTIEIEQLRALNHELRQALEGKGKDEHQKDL